VDYLVTRMFDGGRLIPHHIRAANQVRGILTVKQEDDHLRHRTTLVARLTQIGSMAKPIPALFDVQLVCSTGAVWTLAGYERVTTGVMREDVLLGQAWLVTPAPLEDLRKAELEWARLAELVSQLRAEPGQSPTT
jgi:hypothetical protein